MSKELFVTDDGRQYDSVTTGFSAAGTMSEQSRQKALAVLKEHMPIDETKELSEDAVRQHIIALLRLHFVRR